MATQGGQCAVCSVASINRCARCQVTFYCGSEHQTQDWKTHKLECKRLAAAREASASGITLDPLATDFHWSAYQASSHRKPLGVHGRPPPQMTVHTTIRPGVKNEADMRNLTDPWHGDWSDKKKAHEKLIDGFRLWQDDINLWKGVMRGLYAKQDPFPEFEKFMKRAKPHLPKWWTEADTKATLIRARSTDAPNIYDALEKDRFNERWQSPTAAMAIRMWVDTFVDVTVGK